MAQKADWQERIQEELESLRTARDEVRVKLHLGKAEVAERVEALEKKWHHAEARFKVLAEQAKEEAEDVGQAARLLLDELKEGVEHLRKLL